MKEFSHESTRKYTKMTDKHVIDNVFDGIILTAGTHHGSESIVAKIFFVPGQREVENGNLKKAFGKILHALIMYIIMRILRIRSNNDILL